jgi:hypothetical protein
MHASLQSIQMSPWLPWLVSFCIMQPDWTAALDLLKEFAIFVKTELDEQCLNGKIVLITLSQSYHSFPIQWQAIQWHPRPHYLHCMYLLL